MKSQEKKNKILKDYPHDIIRSVETILRRYPSPAEKEKAWITFFEEKEKEDGGNLVDRE